MKARRATAQERRELGAAVDIIIEVDHMGASVGKTGLEFRTSQEGARELARVIGEVLLPGVRGRLLDRYWAELDDVVERLQAGCEAEDDVGKARGMAYFIAIMKNAVAPDMEAVRAEAMERWEKQHQEDAADG